MKEKEPPFKLDGLSQDHGDVSPLDWLAAKDKLTEAMTYLLGLVNSYGIDILSKYIDRDEHR